MSYRNYVLKQNYCLFTNQFDEKKSNEKLGKLMREWLLVFKKTQVTARSFEGNIRQFEKYVEPQIGSLKLIDVDHVVLQKLLNEMLKKDLSLLYVKKVKYLLRQFFEYCVDNYYLINNPVDKTKVRSVERKPLSENEAYKAIMPKERKRFIKCLDENKSLKPICLTMMFAGLRIGETLGLMWKDIDFKSGTIRIERAITRKPIFDESGKVIKRENIIGATKTICSYRTVPMPTLLLDALREYYLKQKEKTKKYGRDFVSPNCFVFCKKDGGFRTYDSVKNSFQNFLRKYDLKKYKIHFHGLRHTFSNMLFEAEQNPKLIQALLGHKDVKTTISVYNSVDKSYFEKAKKVLNNQFKQFT